MNDLHTTVPKKQLPDHQFLPLWWLRNLRIRVRLLPQPTVPPKPQTRDPLHLLLGWDYLRALWHAVRIRPYLIRHEITKTPRNRAADSPKISVLSLWETSWRSQEVSDFPVVCRAYQEGAQLYKKQKYGQNHWEWYESVSEGDELGQDWSGEDDDRGEGEGAELEV